MVPSAAPFWLIAIHPQLVGSDIGCGMGLFELDITARKLRLDQLAERLHALDQPWDGDTNSVLADAGLSATTFDASLGSIGGGNHFCELQAIEEILEPDIAAQAGLDRDHAYVLVHSGSRGLGLLDPGAHSAERADARLIPRATKAARTWPRMTTRCSGPSSIAASSRNGPRRPRVRTCVP